MEGHDSPRLPLMVDLSGPALTPDERELLSERRVPAVCLFGRNVVDRNQVEDLVTDLRSVAGPELVVAVDQEGGGVVRLLDVPYPPAAMALGAADDPDLTRRVAEATARGLIALGVNLDLAPVADVNSNPRNPVIADRAFGDDPELVARHVSAFVEGLQSEGVGATLKHFPGHGDTSVDSHLELPTVDRGLPELRGTELRPFAAGIAAGASAVMTAHIVVPSVDPGVPATLSARVLRGLLRAELGFGGVIVTDALDMRAISSRWPAAEAAVASVAAGADLPLVIGSAQEHAVTLAELDAARGDGRLDPAEVAAAVGRIADLAGRFPGRARGADSAWGDGDAELLAEAARRGLLVKGELPEISAGSRVALMAWRRVRASAASQVDVDVVGPLVNELERRGVAVTRFEPRADWPRAAVAAADVLLYASTTRVLPDDEEVAAAGALGAAARAAGRPFAHVALWNPYSADVVPGPSLVAFGFRERQAGAVAERLMRA